MNNTMNETTTTAEATTTSSSHHHNYYHELKWNAAPPLDAAASAEQQDQTPSSMSSSSNNARTPIQEEQQQQRHFLPLSKKRTALLVVDVQPEYWSQCREVRKDFPEFPNNLKVTIDTCRDHGLPVIWVRADYKYSHSPWLKQFARIHNHNNKENNKEAVNDNNTANNHNPNNMRTEVPCDPKTFVWEEFATPKPDEILVPKTSWSSTSNTKLMQLLQSTYNVDTVLVCGLITSVCVQHSAFGIFEAGYRTILVHDACADRGLFRHQAALALYGDYMYELITSTQLRNTQFDEHEHEEKPNTQEEKKEPVAVVQQQQSLLHSALLQYSSARDQDDNNKNNAPSLPPSLAGVAAGSLSSSPSEWSSTTSSSSSSSQAYYIIQPSPRDEQQLK